MSEPTAPETPALPRPGIAATLQRICDALERRPWLAILLFIVIYLPSAFEASHTRLLWHDEIYTYWIAQAPTFRAMLADLQTLDLNPPLLYTLTRLSFHLFGVSTLSTRLPEIFFFLVALLAIFRFVRLRLGVTFALFAVGLLMECDIAYLRVEARPYAILLGCLAVAMVGWQQAASPELSPTRRHRALALTIIFLGVLGMMFSHIFAILSVSALIAAELWRQLRQRKLDLPILLALSLPLLAVVTYVPMLRNHGAAIFPAAFQPTGEKIFFFYIDAINRELVVLCLAAFSALLFLRLGLLKPAPPARGPRWFFTQSEWVLLILLLASPLVIMVELLLTHGAFWERYGAPASFAVVMLTAALLARWTIRNGRPDPRAAFLGFGIVILMSGLWTAIPRQIAAHRLIPTAANMEPIHKPCQSCAQTLALNPTLPLVDASGLAFVEMNLRESPETLSRVFYLTDKEASTSIAHANMFEPMPRLATRFHFHGHIQPYPAFIAQHPHFFVLGTYDYPEDWLLTKLIQDHANLRVIGRVNDSYMNTELYEVQLAQ